jgi:hypothetical protein
MLDLYWHQFSCIGNELEDFGKLFFMKTSSLRIQIVTKAFKKHHETPGSSVQKKLQNKAHELDTAVELPRICFHPSKPQVLSLSVDFRKIKVQ